MTTNSFNMNILSSTHEMLKVLENILLNLEHGECKTLEQANFKLRVIKDRITPIISKAKGHTP